MLKLSAFFVLLLLAISSGCIKPPEGYHYLVASLGKGSEEFIGIKDGFDQVSQTLTIVRRFEKKLFCEGERDSFIKNEYNAECIYQNPAYEPAFRGEPIGKWFAFHYLGSLPATVIIYESFPAVADKLALAQLKATVPNVLKFAGLDRMPAQVRLFSPAGEASGE